jgi:hypothetical protein
MHVILVLEGKLFLLGWKPESKELASEKIIKEKINR